MLQDFSFYSNIYASLANYRKNEARKSQEQGIPLIRAMFLEHGDSDPETFRI